MTANSERQAQLVSAVYPENPVYSSDDEMCGITGKPCVYGGHVWMGGAVCQECGIHKSKQK